MDDYYQFLWYRSDDHGNGPGEATPLAGTPALAPDGSNRTVVSATGAIERTADTDVLMFAAAAGTVRFTMSLVPPDTVTYPWRTYSRSNLDLKLQVFSGTSLAAPLATFDPQAGLLSGSYTFAAPAEDVYYVVLTGVGQGADASSGYTAYGSLGEYSLTTDFPTAAHTQLPPTTPPQPSPPPPPRRRSQPPAPLPSQPPPDPSSGVRARAMCGCPYAPKPSSADRTAPLMKWLSLAQSIISALFRSSGLPTRLRGNRFISFWPASVCQCAWFSSVSM